MHSDIELFLDFISKLKELGVIDDEEITTALDSLEGIEGVISEKYFIFGYEELGWFLSTKLSHTELKNFISKNHELLMGHKGPRYYFSQSLIDQKGITKEDQKELIRCMPKDYQVYLGRQFVDIYKSMKPN